MQPDVNGLGSKDRRRLLDRVFEATSYGVTITDLTPAIITVNPAFTKVTGWQPEEVIGKNPSILSSGRHPISYYEEMWRALLENGSWQGEIWNRKKDGEILAEWLAIDAVPDADGNTEFYVAVFSDITVQKRSEDQLKTLAYQDPLTALPNRLAFESALDQALALSSRYNRTFAVLALDLNGFKAVNDTFGHEIGDLLLTSVAQRLASCVRSSDTVARLGGDEFIILCSEVDGREGAEIVAGKIADAVSHRYMLRGETVYVSASVGTAYFPDDAPDAESLLRIADAKMYETKRDAKGLALIDR